MNITITKKLPTNTAIIKAFPLSGHASEKVMRDRQEVKNILSGKDPRMLIIVGPCSAWPAPAVLQYAEKLLKLERQLNSELKILMRVYIQKPRTNKGWTGPITQPDPFALPDLAAGLNYSRRMMVEIVELGLPIADEAVFTGNASAFIDLLSWVAIGARSTEDQEHRIHASALDCAVGMKNPTGGSIEIGINSVVAAQHGHTTIRGGMQIETDGNPFAHLVLRGGLDRPNYHLEDMIHAQAILKKQQVLNPSIIIDASHDNSKINGRKDPLQQINVANEVIAAIKSDPALRKIIKGFMFESFLKTGNQKIESLTPATIDQNGLSITDPCLGWNETEALLRTISQEWHSLQIDKN